MNFTIVWQFQIQKFVVYEGGSYILGSCFSYFSYFFIYSPLILDSHFLVMWLTEVEQNLKWESLEGKGTSSGRVEEGQERLCCP
jgi:hypothetical protein